MWGNFKRNVPPRQAGIAIALALVVVWLPTLLVIGVLVALVVVPIWRGVEHLNEVRRQSIKEREGEDDG